MTPHRNPTGLIAILVESTLYLPSGRPVPADDVAGWEPSDDEPEAASPACYAAALAHQRQIEALGNVKPAPRVLPVLDAPRPYVERADCARFRARCAKLAAHIRTLPDENTGYHAAQAERIEGLAALARLREPTEPMHQLLDGAEREYDPAEVARALAEVDALAAWAEGVVLEPGTARLVGWLLTKVRASLAHGRLSVARGKDLARVRAIHRDYVERAARVGDVL